MTISNEIIARGLPFERESENICPALIESPTGKILELQNDNCLHKNCVHLNHRLPSRKRRDKGLGEARYLLMSNISKPLFIVTTDMASLVTL